MACFYCPEMCRFVCPTAEAQRDNSITPRAKMSLIHLAEKGVDLEKTFGGWDRVLWTLDQCVSCGRCTEFCAWEVPVGKRLREERSKIYERLNKTKSDESSVTKIYGEKIFFVDPLKEKWWKEEELFQKQVLRYIGCTVISKLGLDYNLWESGQLSQESEKSILKNLEVLFRNNHKIVFESAEEARAVLAIAEKYKKNFKFNLLWQELFSEFSNLDFGPEISFHEIGALSRILPRFGISVPMHERGFLPQHSGWNSIACGGEGFYSTKYKNEAHEMTLRFWKDLKEDRREIKTLICQSANCENHLKEFEKNENAQVTYWVEFLKNELKGDELGD